jgi:ABC-type arginine transport system ATPase subunit
MPFLPFDDFLSTDLEKNHSLISKLNYISSDYDSQHNIFAIQIQCPTGATDLIMGPSYYLRPDLFSDTQYLIDELSRIETLQIHHNQMLVRNAVSISKALKVNKSLQELDMSCQFSRNANHFREIPDTTS